jgi:hypothetical protein
MSKKIIEDVISEVLTDGTKENALDLIAYLRENKMYPAQSSSVTWKISSKGCIVCYFRFDFNAGTLRINPFISEYKHDSLSEELKEIVWAAKTNAGMPCGENCHPCSYLLKTVFGKEYDDACGSSFAFVNPNVSEIECIKELIKMRMNLIKNGRLMSALPKNFEW